MSDFHFVTGTGAAGSLLASPVADGLNGTGVTDVVSMRKYEEVYFIVTWGVASATATHTVTILACDDFVPNTTSAIPFMYKRISSGETNTAWTAAALAGMTTTTGSHQIYVYKVKASDLVMVSGVVYENVKLQSVEVDGGAVVAGCVIMMAKPRFNESTLDVVTA